MCWTGSHRIERLSRTCFQRIEESSAIGGSTTTRYRNRRLIYLLTYMFQQSHPDGLLMGQLLCEVPHSDRSFLLLF